MNVYQDVDARDAIALKVDQVWKAEYPDIKYFTENLAEPNLDKLKDFMSYKINFLESKQIAISPYPIDRTYGTVEFYFGARKGTGTRKLLIMRDYMKSEMKALSLKPVKTLIPSPGKSNTGNGWHFETLFVPFYFDGMPKA